MPAMVAVHQHAGSVTITTTPAAATTKPRADAHAPTKHSGIWTAALLQEMTNEELNESLATRVLVVLGLG